MNAIPRVRAEIDQCQAVIPQIDRLPGRGGDAELGVAGGLERYRHRARLGVGQPDDAADRSCGRGEVRVHDRVRTARVERLEHVERCDDALPRPRVYEPPPIVSAW